ncbi:MAG: alpha/beta fold hydrolase [Rhizobiaceae bacterium]
MTNFQKLSLALLITTPLFVPLADAKSCGVKANMCKTPLGEYALRMPDTASAKPIPALLYFHGAGGSGPRSLRNKTMVNAFLKRGYAVIAPSALIRPNSRFGAIWSFLPNRPVQRDEMAFTREILADAAKKHNIDRNNILMGGFSIGGSLTWYLACQDPKIARAFAPVAGAFWRPHPDAIECNGPVKMLHTHGWRDNTVPLEGRILGGGALLQGDVFQGLQIMREVNGCENMKADSYKTNNQFWRRIWTNCRKGSALEFALHTGGHSVPKSWADMAINWFENVR